MIYFTRVCFNSSNWQHPTGEAKEEENTFHSRYGFGHEEWLFRFEWQISSWQYGFLQGVNKRFGLRKKGKERAADIVLYTIDSQKRRRYVACIYDLEFLSDKQADASVQYFKDFGWYAKMLEEVSSAGGKKEAFEFYEGCASILNIRFRPENVEWFPSGRYAERRDPVWQHNRYMLYRGNEEALMPIVGGYARGRRGQDTPPSNSSYFRRGSAGKECTPEHSMMQRALSEELRREYPNADITFEKNFVDVTVETESERILYEIKSDYSPKAVLRQAIGQLLEYAYHSRDLVTSSIRLVAVGRVPLQNADELYLDHLRNTFKLPLEYRSVSIE